MTGRAGSGALLCEGFVASADALASVEEGTDRHGARSIDVKLSGGLAFRVLPDQGLDIGPLWWAGFPVSWRSPQPPARLSAGREPTWLSAWGGGMVTTCGVDNIGPGRDGYGLHGSHHATPAEDVQVRRLSRDNHLGVLITGIVRNVEMFGRRITVRREIEAWTDAAAFDLRDEITNEGMETVAIPLLYHVNFGAPFISPGSRIEVDSGDTVVRDAQSVVPDPRRMPAPTTEIAEAVFEHRGFDGFAPLRSAVVESPALGARARLTWTAGTLPRLYEWVWPTRGGWALGIEPANSALFGPDRDQPHAGAPMLTRGATTTTHLSLSIERLPASPAETARPEV